ncbi:MAG: sulfotransferase [Thermodesulfobacteriota bacterium]
MSDPITSTILPTPPSDEYLGRAYSFFHSGQLLKAKKFCRRALDSAPHQPQALHLLGIIAHLHGNNDRAEEYIGEALEISPENHAWHADLGNLLMKKGEYGRALPLFRRSLLLQPDDSWALHQLGACLLVEKNFSEAVSCLRKAADLNPGDPLVYGNLGTALANLEDTDGALASFRRSVELAPDNLALTVNLSEFLLAAGRGDEAISCLDAFIAGHPAHYEALLAKAGIYRKCRQYDLAVLALRQAIDAVPHRITAYNELTRLSFEWGQQAVVEETLARALAAQPRNAELRRLYVNYLEKTSQIDKAAAFLDRELARTPDDAPLVLLKAKIERRQGRVREALAVLNRLPREGLEAKMLLQLHFEAGRLHDQLRESDMAMRYLSSANEYARRSMAGSVEPLRARQLNAAIRRVFNDPGVKLPQPSPVGNAVAAPVFLIGFPRSGTTLTENILAAHPLVHTCEEKPALAESLKCCFASYEDYLRQWDVVTEEQVRRMRREYFAHLHTYGRPPEGSVLVDKLPLNMIRAFHAWHLFPDARFIFVYRHPCDVCFSNFMQNYNLNDAMANFLSLRETVDFYAEVMGLWQRQEEILPLRLHRVRYEDLVADVAAEARRMLDFLGLPWNEEVLTFHQRAREKRVINTPSYHQVTQPVYQQARYRWQRYAGYFEPYMEQLRPFIEALGYT